MACRERKSNLKLLRFCVVVLEGDLIHLTRSAGREGNGDHAVFIGLINRAVVGNSCVSKVGNSHDLLANIGQRNIVLTVGAQGGGKVTLLVNDQLNGAVLALGLGRIPEEVTAVVNEAAGLIGCGLTNIGRIVCVQGDGLFIGQLGCNNTGFLGVVDPNILDLDIATELQIAAAQVNAAAILGRAAFYLNGISDLVVLSFFTEGVDMDGAAGLLAGAACNSGGAFQADVAMLINEDGTAAEDCFSRADGTILQSGLAEGRNRAAALAQAALKDTTRKGGIAVRAGLQVTAVTVGRAVAAQVCLTVFEGNTGNIDGTGAAVQVTCMLCLTAFKGAAGDGQCVSNRVHIAAVGSLLGIVICKAVFQVAVFHGQRGIAVCIQVAALFLCATALNSTAGHGHNRSVANRNVAAVGGSLTIFEGTIGKGCAAFKIAVTTGSAGLAAIEGTAGHSQAGGRGVQSQRTACSTGLATDKVYICQGDSTGSIYTCTAVAGRLTTADGTVADGQVYIRAGEDVCTVTGGKTAGELSLADFDGDGAGSINVCTVGLLGGRAGQNRTLTNDHSGVAAHIDVAAGGGANTVIDLCAGDLQLLVKIHIDITAVYSLAAVDLTAGNGQGVDACAAAGHDNVATTGTGLTAVDLTALDLGVAAVIQGDIAAVAGSVAVTDDDVAGVGILAAAADIAALGNATVDFLAVSIQTDHVTVSDLTAGQVQGNRAGTSIQVTGLRTAGIAGTACGLAFGIDTDGATGHSEGTGTDADRTTADIVSIYKACRLCRILICISNTAPDLTTGQVEGAGDIDVTTGVTVSLTAIDHTAGNVQGFGGIDVTATTVGLTSCAAGAGLDISTVRGTGVLLCITAKNRTAVDVQRTGGIDVTAGTNSVGRNNVAIIQTNTIRDFAAIDVDFSGGIAIDVAALAVSVGSRAAVCPADELGLTTGDLAAVYIQYAGMHHMDVTAGAGKASVELAVIQVHDTALSTGRGAGCVVLCNNEQATHTVLCATAGKVTAVDVHNALGMGIGDAAINALTTGHGAVPGAGCGIIGTVRNGPGTVHNVFDDSVLSGRNVMTVQTDLYVFVFDLNCICRDLQISGQIVVACCQSTEIGGICRQRLPCELFTGMLSSTGGCAAANTVNVLFFCRSGECGQTDDCTQHQQKNEKFFLHKNFLLNFFGIRPSYSPCPNIGRGLHNILQ